MNPGARLWLAWYGLLLMAGTGSMACGQSATEAVQEKGPHGKQERFREFLARVNEYDNLRDSVRGRIPNASKRATAEQIQKHQEMLAEKIQDARKDARQGEVFTADSQMAFRRAIDRAYSGKR